MDLFMAFSFCSKVARLSLIPEELVKHPFPGKYCFFGGVFPYWSAAYFCSSTITDVLSI